MVRSEVRSEVRTLTHTRTHDESESKLIIREQKTPTSNGPKTAKDKVASSKHAFKLALRVR